MVSITLQPDSTAAREASLYQEDPTLNSPNGSTEAIGEDNTFTQLFRAIFKFDLSVIPAGSTINSANFTVWLQQPGNWRSSNNRTVSVYRILRDWTYNEATWNKANSSTNWGTAGCSNTTTDREAAAIGSTTFATTDGGNAEKTFTLTASKVQEWLTGGTLTNNGFIVQCATESSDRYQVYGSAEETYPLFRPRLVINYTTQVGGAFLFNLI